MRRKGEKKILSGSQSDLNTNRSSSNFSSTPDVLNILASDPLRKSVSLELLPTTADSGESSRYQNFEGFHDGNFKGYLRLGK